MERKFEGIWIPAELWLRNDLTVSEKMLFVEVKSLDNNFGCVASNKKLGEFIQLTPTNVSRALRTLQEKNLISINYDDFNTFTGRVITCIPPYQNDNPPYQNSKPPYQNSKGAYQNDKHNNTISNTFSNIDNKLSIINADMLVLFHRWLSYKKGKRQTYKSDESMIVCYKKLIKDSDGELYKAEQIIENAIANNYSGFFPLKSYNEPSTPIDSEKGGMVW